MLLASDGDRLVLLRHGNTYNTNRLASGIPTAPGRRREEGRTEVCRSCSDFLNIRAVDAFPGQMQECRQREESLPEGSQVTGTTADAMVMERS